MRISITPFTLSGQPSVTQAVCYTVPCTYVQLLGTLTVHKVCISMNNCQKTNNKQKPQIFPGLKQSVKFSAICHELPEYYYFSTYIS